MNYKLKNILAIIVGVLPVNVILIWYRLTHNEVFSASDMLLYPLIFGGGNILLILALNKYLLKGKINDFNSGRGNWYWDISAGLVLTVICFLCIFIEQATIAPLLPTGKPPSLEVIKLMTDLAKNPVHLAIWLGPVVWIGVALFEELVRVFFLKCLWALSNRKSWEYLSILFVAAFIALAHLYQGAFGIISVGIQGLLLCLYYYIFKRIWPLIISHALYDSIQIIMFVIQVS